MANYINYNNPIAPHARGVANNPNQKFYNMASNQRMPSGTSSVPLTVNRVAPNAAINNALSRYAPNAQTQVAPSNILTPQKTLTLNNVQELASINQFPLAPSITIQIASATGGSAAAIRCYVFNQDVFSNITNNGSGAGSVTYSYQDGFSGAVVNRLLGLTRNGVGAACFGVAVRMVVTSSKAGDAAGLATTNPRFDTYNMLGSSIPTNFNVTTDQTRSDYDSSIEVMTCFQNINYFSQFSIVMPVGDTATLTFYFTENFSR